MPEATALYALSCPQIWPIIKRMTTDFSPIFSESDIAWHTEAGRRANNEDSCAFLLQPDGAAVLLIVADGMGGHASGEVASRLAVDTLVEAYTKNGFAPDAEFLRATLIAVDHEIRRAATLDARREGMGTTVVAALLHQDGALIGHIGDSRALQFRNGCVRRLTRDHLFAIDVLGIDENQAKSHPQGNVLSQALGAPGNLAPAINSFDWQPGDVFLLCTDGVSECVPEPQMQSVLDATANREKPLPEAAAALVRRALENRSGDNCTVALVRVPEPKDDDEAAPSD